MRSNTPTQKKSTLRAYVRSSLFVTLVLVMLLPVTLLWALGLDRVRSRLVRFFLITASIITGLQVRVEGSIAAQRPLMLVANHSSYLDIFVLGSLARLSFTPKLEIRSWPLIGFLCVLADCVFIERRPTDMQRAQAEMGARLSRGKVLALFPEGTTGNGFDVMQFKSGFLNLVETHHLPLQPVSIAYTHLGDVPLSAATREQVSWIGDADFVTHFWHLLKFSGVRVLVTMHEPKFMTAYEDRKALAKACEETIRTGLHATLEANGVVS